MVKFAALSVALLAGSASAFTAPSNANRAGSVSLSAEKSKSLPFLNRPALLDGSMAGDVGFDPLGLSNIDDVGIDLYWLREAELKHCRLCMLAIVGFIWPEIFGPAPGCEAATDPCQTDAFWQIWNSHPQYIAFGFIMVMLIEAFSGIATTTGRETGFREPGDFGFDPLGFKKGGDEKYAKLKEQEVANGRLAMWASAGALLQGCTTHEGALQNLSHAL
jgi:light-harvesting complex I chlorophyll a/b binding protein 1